MTLIYISNIHPILSLTHIFSFSLTNKKVFSICCKDAVDAYNETKKKKLHPLLATRVRHTMETCFNSTYEGVTKTSGCNDVYQSLLDCQSGKEWSKCLDIQKELEKCAVKSKLGELA